MEGALGDHAQSGRGGALLKANYPDEHIHVWATHGAPLGMSAATEFLGRFSAYRCGSGGRHEAPGLAAGHPQLQVYV